MKSFKKWVFGLGAACTMLCLTLMFVGIAYASEIVEVPIDQFVEHLLASIAGWKGLTTVAKIYAVVQLLALALQTQHLGAPLSKLTGKYKMLVILGITFASTAVGLVAIEGLTWSAALVHGTTATAFANFIHQVIKQFLTKKGNE